MVELDSPLVRSYVSWTWESVSSFSSCGTAPSSLAKGNCSQQSCRPHHTRRCQSLLLLRGTLGLGKLLSAWRWRMTPDCGLLGPLQSQAEVREKKSFFIRSVKYLQTCYDFKYHQNVNKLSILNSHNWTLHSCGTWDRHQQQSGPQCYNAVCSSYWVWPWSQTGPWAS